MRDDAESDGNVEGVFCAEHRDLPGLITEPQCFIPYSCDLVSEHQDHARGDRFYLVEVQRYIRRFDRTDGPAFPAIRSGAFPKSGSRIRGAGT